MAEEKMPFVTNIKGDQHKTETNVKGDNATINNFYILHPHVGDFLDTVPVAKLDDDTKPSPVAKKTVKDKAPNNKKPDAIDYNTVITGLIGTDQDGNTYSPQKFIFVHSKDSKDTAIITAVLEKKADEWNSIEGCSCALFTQPMLWSGTAVNVIAGYNHGFTNIGIPEVAAKKNAKTVKPEPPSPAAKTAQPSARQASQPPPSPL